jgi:hypothetical protein
MHDFGKCTDRAEAADVDCLPVFEHDDAIGSATPNTGPA